MEKSYHFAGYFTYKSFNVYQKEAIYCIRLPHKEIHTHK